MSQKVREEMLPRPRLRYAGRVRQGRTRMIEELCEQFGYSRKHAIKLLGAKAGWGGDPAVRKGRPPLHGPQADRLLAARKARCKHRGRSGTKPGSLL